MAITRNISLNFGLRTVTNKADVKTKWKPHDICCYCCLDKG